MKTTPEGMTYIHPFADAGLGVAPYRFVCCITHPTSALCEANPDAYNRAVREAHHQAKALGVHLCTCEYCGMALINNYVIRDADGKHFVVGCDCVERTGDSQLITTVEAEKRKQERIKRAIRAEAAREERRLQFEIELDAQRARNNGLTDYEVAQRAEEAARQAKAREITAANEWLLTVLRRVPSSGEFLPSIIRDLQRHTLASELSWRAQDILRDIYSREVGGTGKANKATREAAADEFDAKIKALTG